MSGERYDIGVICGVGVDLLNVRIGQQYINSDMIHYNAIQYNTLDKMTRNYKD